MDTCIDNIINQSLDYISDFSKFQCFRDDPIIEILIRNYTLQKPKLRNLLEQLVEEFISRYYDEPEIPNNIDIWYVELGCLSESLMDGFATFQHFSETDLKFRKFISRTFVTETMKFMY